MSGRLERFGNALPEPAALFALAFIAVHLLSAIGPWPTVMDASGATVVVTSLLTPDGLAQALTRAVSNFVAFPPLGVVLVMMLGVGVAEQSGFVAAAVTPLITATPRRWLAPATVLAGILFHVAADAGFVLLLPLAAAAWHTAGRHPLAGIAAAYAGLSGGFAANLVPGPIDPILAGLTEQAARIVDPAASVGPLANWTFTASSALVLVAVGGWVTDRYVEPALASREIAPPTALTERAASPAGGLLALGVVLALAGVAIAIPGSPLRGEGDNPLAPNAPWLRAVGTLLALGLGIAGAVHGRVHGTLPTHRHVVSAMANGMTQMSGYLVLAFAAAQFLDAFDRSGIGRWLAIGGAQTLGQLALPEPALVVVIVIAVALLNLVIASASAKFAIVAPVIVPMAMLLGVDPATTMAAFRVGDGVTNVLTPLMPYVPLVLELVRRWSPTAGTGTLWALMWPYSASFAVCWTAWLLVFVAAGWPLGL